jgi:hypothetical protein
MQLDATDLAAGATTVAPIARNSEQAIGTQYVARNT